MKVKVYLFLATMCDACCKTTCDQLNILLASLLYFTDYSVEDLLLTCTIVWQVYSGPGGHAT